MGTLSDDHIKKRLKSVNASQESVQTVAEWILRYKDSSIDRIAKCWVDLYKEVGDSARTALVFVMNDVVQKATKKGGSSSVAMAFHPHVINAIGLSSPSVKKSISRCVEVFEQRKTFPPHIIEEMKAALVSQISIERDKDEFAEIDSLLIIRQIEGFHQNETLTEKARDIVSKTNFNFKTAIEGRVKERIEGQRLLQEMEIARQKLVTFLNSVEKHQEKGLKLINTLTQLKSSFNHQLKDVVLVNDAYEKFANGIRETKNELEKMIELGNLPGRQLSPPLDAPSPGPNEDPFAQGIGENEVNGGADDMEMDEDIPAPEKTALIPPNKYVAPIPAVPFVDPRLQKFLNNTQGTTPILNDPRQSRFMNAMQIQQLPPVASPSIPPPNFSQPPPPMPPGTSFQSQPPGIGQHPINIDTSQPPPCFFTSEKAGSSLSPHSLPPNSPFFTPPTMAKNQIPQPHRAPHEIPNNAPLQSPSLMPMGRPPILPQSGGHRMNRPEFFPNFSQKRRSSNADSNGANYSKRRSWNEKEGGNNGIRGGRTGKWYNNGRIRGGPR